MRRHLLVLAIGLALAPQLRAQQDKPRATLDCEMSPKQLAFTPDGKRLVVAGEGLQIWDGATSKRLATLETDVTAFAISPDGKIVAAGNLFDLTIELVDLTTGRRTAKWKMPGDREGEGSGALAFSPDGKTLAAFHAGEVTLWDAAAGKPGKMLRAAEASEAGEAVAFSPDGKTLASSAGGKVKIWNPGAGDLIKTLKSSNSAESLVFSPDGRMLFVGNADAVVEVWDLSGGRLKAAFKSLNEDVDGADSQIALRPDGRLVAATTGIVLDSQARVWDVATGQKVMTVDLKGLLPGSDISAESVAFSPDGKTLAVGGSEELGGGKVFLWSVPEARK